MFYAGQAMTGFAIPGVELRVVDPDDRDVPPDGQAIGEIVARGDGVTQALLAATGSFRRHPCGAAGSTPETWPRSIEDGYLLIVDRKKDIIASGGEKYTSSPRI